MKLGAKGSGWLSEKNVHIFFQGYCELSEKWRIQPPSQSHLEELFVNVDKYKYPTRSNAVLKYKILQECRLNNSKFLADEYFPFIRKLQKEGFWLEKSLSNKQTFNSNSFLAAQAIAHRSDKNTLLVQKRPESQVFERSKRNLRSILKKVGGLGHKSHGYFTKFFDDMDSGKSALFYALAAIHSEVTDNIDHWMYYPGNRRCEKYNRELFGDTLLLEIQLKTLIDTEHNETGISLNIKNYLAKYPIEISDYIEAHFSRQQLNNLSREGGPARQLSFVEMNYIDNGRGIRKNILNFTKTRLADFTLEEVVTKNMSTRNIEGSGMGFYKMIEQTRKANSLFFLQSGNEIISVSGHGSKNFSYREQTEYIYGTLITVLVPVTGL